jgi:hypothetical protein
MAFSSSVLLAFIASIFGAITEVWPLNGAKRYIAFGLLSAITGVPLAINLFYFLRTKKNRVKLIIVGLIKAALSDYFERWMVLRVLKGNYIFCNQSMVEPEVILNPKMILYKESGGRSVSPRDRAYEYTFPPISWCYDWVTVNQFKVKVNTLGNREIDEIEVTCDGHEFDEVANKNYLYFVDVGSMNILVHQRPEGLIVEMKHRSTLIKRSFVASPLSLCGSLRLIMCLAHWSTYPEIGVCKDGSSRRRGVEVYHVSTIEDLVKAVESESSWTIGVVEGPVIFEGESCQLGIDIYKDWLQEVFGDLSEVILNHNVSFWKGFNGPALKSIIWSITKNKWKPVKFKFGPNWMSKRYRVDISYILETAGQPRLTFIEMGVKPTKWAIALAEEFKDGCKNLSYKRRAKKEEIEKIVDGIKSKRRGELTESDRDMMKYHKIKEKLERDKEKGAGMSNLKAKAGVKNPFFKIVDRTSDIISDPSLKALSLSYKEALQKKSSEAVSIERGKERERLERIVPVGVAKKRETSPVGKLLSKVEVKIRGNRENKPEPSAWSFVTITQRNVERVRSKTDLILKNYYNVLKSVGEEMDSLDDGRQEEIKLGVYKEMISGSKISFNRAIYNMNCIGGPKNSKFKKTLPWISREERLENRTTEISKKLFGTEKRVSLEGLCEAIERNLDLALADRHKAFIRATSSCVNHSEGRKVRKSKIAAHPVYKREMLRVQSEVKGVLESKRISKKEKRAKVSEIKKLVKMKAMKEIFSVERMEEGLHKARFRGGSIKRCRDGSFRVNPVASIKGGQIKENEKCLKDYIEWFYKGGQVKGKRAEEWGRAKATVETEEDSPDVSLFSCESEEWSMFSLEEDWGEEPGDKDTSKGEEGVTGGKGDRNGTVEKSKYPQDECRKRTKSRGK